MITEAEIGVMQSISRGISAVTRSSKSQTMGFPQPIDNGLELLASRTGREEISFELSHSVCDCIMAAVGN